MYTNYSYDDLYNPELMTSTDQTTTAGCHTQSDYSTIDYFQFDFSELQLHSCWKLVHNSRVNQRLIPLSTDVARLENLSWRKWTKLKYGLAEVSPETVDWYKDCDVTWLYGPLGKSQVARFAKEPLHKVERVDSLSSLSSSSTTESLVLYSETDDDEDDEDAYNIKPILKSRSTLEPRVMKQQKFKKNVSFADMVDIRQF